MTAASLESALHSIQQDGFWTMEDADVGRRVDAMVRQGYRFKSEEGLDLVKETALDDRRIRDIIEFFFPQAVFGYYKVFGKTKLDHCVLNRTTEQLQILEVQLWSSGAKWIFYGGSHLHMLNAKKAPNGLLAPSPDRLKLPGIRPIVNEMAEGGFALADARLGFKILEGKTIKLGFMTPDEAQSWFKMELPYSLIGKARTMDSETIVMNFKFKKPKTEDSNSNQQQSQVPNP